MADIEWRDIPGYKGRYQASSDGRVKSLARIVYGSGCCPFRPIPERVLKPHLHPSGRLLVLLHRDGPKTQLVHRLVALAFLSDSYFDGAYVCHGDGNPLNNNVENLRWATNSENQYDSIRHGTHAEARKTHCVNGHPFDDANTLIGRNSNGRPRRDCRRCNTERASRKRARKRAERMGAVS